MCWELFVVLTFEKKGSIKISKLSKKIFLQKRENLFLEVLKENSPQDIKEQKKEIL
jgi:hypothetical protein